MGQEGRKGRWWEARIVMSSLKTHVVFNSLVLAKILRHFELSCSLLEHSCTKTGNLEISSVFSWLLQSPRSSNPLLINSSYWIWEYNGMKCSEWRPLSSKTISRYIYSQVNKFLAIYTVLTASKAGLYSPGLNVFHGFVKNPFPIPRPFPDAMRLETMHSESVPELSTNTVQLYQNHTSENLRGWLKQ